MGSLGATTSVRAREMRRVSTGETGGAFELLAGEHLWL